jgi:hypothetical protein
MNRFFTQQLREKLDPQIDIQEADLHINDAEFGKIAANLMSAMMA